MIGRSLRAALLASLVVAGSGAAYAQDDVVVMRRQVGRANIAEHAWREGAWRTAAACSAKAPATRTVTCVRTSDETPVDPAFCGGQKRPSETGEAEDRRACTYDWHEGDWSDWSPSSCAKGATHTRAVTCMRYGDAKAEPAGDDARCLSVRAKPVESDTGDVFASCSYSWQRTGGACDGTSGYRIDTYGCQRSGGSVQAEIVTDAYSVGRCGAKPQERTQDVMCGAGGKLANGDFETCSGAPWSNGAGANGVIIATGSQAISGSCSATITQNYYSNQYFARQLVTLEAGRKYRLTFRHRAEVPSNNQSQGVWVRLENTSGIAIVSGNAAGKYPSYTQDAVWPEYGWAIIRSNQSVQTGAVTFVATSSSVLVSIENNNTGSITLDDVSLFEEK